MSKWDVSNIASWKASDYPVGAKCIEAGNSRDYITGSWRSERPVWDADACKNCLLCWVHCPDSSIVVKDRKMTGIDLDHCKGCGICVTVCKFNALEMHLESEFTKEA
jgi:pyruvate ferredoxin oxidoreductase delta subunit